MIQMLLVLYPHWFPMIQMFLVLCLDLILMFLMYYLGLVLMIQKCLGLEMKDLACHWMFLIQLWEGNSIVDLFVEKRSP
jgi:hypothetical protein